MYQENSESRTSTWGWSILLILSALLLLNGMGWFFMGPSLSMFEQETGIPLSEFRAVYPTVADGIATNARQVAIWFMAFGLLALLVAREGFRNGSRWAWNAAWVIVAAPAAVGLNEVATGETGFFSTAVLGVTALGLLGLLLARSGWNS